MNEKEVKLREAADMVEVNLSYRGSESPVINRMLKESISELLVQFAKSEAARQYHSPSKQEGTEELPSDNECTDIAFDFGYGCDPPKGNKQQEDIHDAAVWGLKKMRDYIKQNYTLTKKQP